MLDPDVVAEVGAQAVGGSEGRRGERCGIGVLHRLVGKLHVGGGCDYGARVAHLGVECLVVQIDRLSALQRPEQLEGARYGLPGVDLVIVGERVDVPVLVPRVAPIVGQLAGAGWVCGHIGRGGHAPAHRIPDAGHRDGKLARCIGLIHSLAGVADFETDDFRLVLVAYPSEVRRIRVLRPLRGQRPAIRGHDLARLGSLGHAGHDRSRIDRDREHERHDGRKGLAAPTPLASLQCCLVHG